jgi:hypothetical protein
MAQMTSTVHRDIERLLDLLLWQWNRLPEVEQEIDRWDWAEQVDFIEEWPLEEQRLKRLMNYVANGVLTPEQKARYESLMRVVTNNQPIIERLRRH